MAKVMGISGIKSRPLAYLFDQSLNFALTVRHALLFLRVPEHQINDSSITCLQTFFPETGNMVSELINQRLRKFDPPVFILFGFVESMTVETFGNMICFPVKIKMS